MPDTAWMVRAGNSNELIDRFRNHSCVAIGWPEVGDYGDSTTRADRKAQYRAAYPKRNDQRAATDASQLFAFAHRIAEGDWVLTYDKDAREYHIGTVDGSSHLNETREAAG